MNGSTRFLSPPGMATVHRATLDALAEHGPRRVGVTHIARRANSNRQFFYRNWASPQALVVDVTLKELRRLLHVAREVTHPLPPHCLAVRIVVRAARLLREHPVVRAVALTDPVLVHSAVLRPTSVWHQMAMAWLREHVIGSLQGVTDRDATALAVLTTALPYALTPPPDSSDPAAEREDIDRRVGLAVHGCLGLPPACPDCADPPTPH